MRTGAAGCDDHGGKLNRPFALLGNFQRALHIAQRAQRVRTAHRDHVGTIALSFNAGRQLFQLSIRIGQRVAHFDLGIEQIKQQSVTVSQIVLSPGTHWVFQQRHAVQAKFCRHRCRLTDMVRLDGSGGNQRIRTFPQRISREKLKLAQLITTHCKRGDVITLDEDFTTEIIGKARQIFKRRRRADQLQTREKG